MSIFGTDETSLLSDAILIEQQAKEMKRRDDVINRLNAKLDRHEQIIKDRIHSIEKHRPTSVADLVNTQGILALLEGILKEFETIPR